MDLKNREWVEFDLKAIFNDVQRGKRLKKGDHINGKTPYISSTGLNNGVDNFVSNRNRVRIFSNCLTIANSGSVGVSFYQPFSFVASDHVTKLGNGTFNKYIYLFISTIVSRLGEKYSFNREINDNRIQKEKIMLPVNSNLQPDYDYMELYMFNLERKKIELYKKHISTRISELEAKSSGGGVKPLNELQWDVFKLNQIFEIENCKCSNASNLKPGNIPYVGATNRNNGVMKFVQKEEKLVTKGNCLAFICDGEGSVGFSIYKSEDFIGSTTVKVGRSDNLNKYVATFITTIADTVRTKYNFGFKRNESHLKNEVLLLPINSGGHPDYEYMENYMKQLEYNKLKKYLKHLKHLN